MTKKTILIILSACIGLLIAVSAIGPYLDNPTVVQDDFRQTNFWFWQFWDSELFQGDFFAKSFERGMGLAPIYIFIWKSIIPNFFSDLIYASKFYALALSLLGALAAYLLISKISESKNSFFALSFVLSISVVFWCTDHVSAAHIRSSVWLLLLLYLWLKSSKEDLWAGLFCLPALFFNPTAFILCMSAEGFSWLLNIRNKVLTKTFYIGILNTFITVLNHFVLRSGVEYAGEGKALSYEQMSSMPEFNPGGRSAIFGSKLWDGSWWTNEHWGFGYGYLEISKLVFIALFCIIVYFIVCRPTFIKLKSLLMTAPAYLVYGSISLYFLSQLVFPLLYFPSRYISTSFILLSALVSYLCLEQIIIRLFFKSDNGEIENMTRAERRKIEKSKSTRSSSSKKPVLLINIIYLMLGISFWLYFKNFYHPRYVSINPKINHTLSLTPKDSLIAGHPLLPDLNVASITSKRMVYVDFERSLAFTMKAVEEIRRRHFRVFDLVYAKSKEEFESVAEAEGITHVLALYDFYLPNYLTNPRYVNPYNEYLKEKVKLNEGESFYIADFLKDKQRRYGLIDVANMGIK